MILVYLILIVVSGLLVETAYKKRRDTLFGVSLVVFSIGITCLISEVWTTTAIPKQNTTGYRMWQEYRISGNDTLETKYFIKELK